MSDKLYIRFCFCLGLLLCSKSGISQITKDSLFLQHLIGKEQYHDAITFTNQLERKYPISTQAQLQLAYQKDLPSIRSNSSIRQVSTSKVSSESPFSQNLNFGQDYQIVI
jgi:hypothetical protein